MSIAKMSLPVRWVFDVQKWKPSKEEWDLAFQCIQQEEKSRLERFVYKEDTKSSLIGRLLLRKLCNEAFSIPYKNIELGRDKKERPYLKNGFETNELNQRHLKFDFNISHQGNYCVLAAENNPPVGIDVMKMIYSAGNQTLPEMFNLMRRKFSSSEWDFICGPVPEKEQEKRFYRNWSLKESFVKAEGSGLGFSLQRLSFQCNTVKLRVGEVTTDTHLYIDGSLAQEWFFEETLLDEDHCVAVALQKPSLEVPTFKHLTFEDLVKRAEPLREIDPESWDKFVAKPTKSR